MNDLENKLRLEINKILNKLGKDYKFILYNELVKRKKVASGKLVKSISYEIKDSEMLFLAEKYIEYVDAGRRPGKYAPIDEIKVWCSIKGIPGDAAWAINRSIFRRGIRPTNVLNKSMSIFEKRNNKLVEGDLADLYEQLIEEMLKKEMKDYGV